MRKDAMLWVELQIEDEILTIVNIYAPNKDSPDFFIKLFEDIDKLDTTNIIIAGDFNLTLNTDMDRYKSSSNNDRSARLLSQFMEDNEYCDVWRCLHPERKNFTWRKTSQAGTIASRIDMIIIQQSILSWVEECEIFAGCESDHSAVFITLNIPVNQCGPGVWRLNNKILEDEQFCGDIRDLIKIPELAAISDSVKKWEYFKYKCAEIAKRRSRTIANDNRILLENLYKLKTTYEQEYMLDSTEQITKCYEEVGQRIQEIETDKANSVIFRSRALYGQKKVKEVQNTSFPWKNAIF